MTGNDINKRKNRFPLKTGLRRYWKKVWKNGRQWKFPRPRLESRPERREGGG